MSSEIMSRTLKWYQDNYPDFTDEQRFKRAMADGWTAAVIDQLEMKSHKDDTFGFEIPNLDNTLNSPQEYFEASTVLYWLSEYLVKKGRAITQREHGLISSARSYEEECDKIYKQLPEWARW